MVPTKDIPPVLKNPQVEVAEDQMSRWQRTWSCPWCAETSVVSADVPGQVVPPAKKLLEIIGVP